MQTTTILILCLPCASAFDIHIVFHLILTITLWVRYQHLTDEDLILKTQSWGDSKMAA